MTITVFNSSSGSKDLEDPYPVLSFLLFPRHAVQSNRSRLAVREPICQLNETPYKLSQHNLNSLVHLATVDIKEKGPQCVLIFFFFGFHAFFTVGITARILVFPLQNKYLDIREQL